MCKLIINTKKHGYTHTAYWTWARASLNAFSLCVRQCQLHFVSANFQAIKIIWQKSNMITSYKMLCFCKKKVLYFKHNVKAANRYKKTPLTKTKQYTSKAANALHILVCIYLYICVCVCLINFGTGKIDLDKCLLCGNII